jgi:hypothetical protein
MNVSLLAQGGSEPQAQATTESTTAPVTAPVTESTVTSTTDGSQRPEWLPEKYKSPEELAKAYKELESKLGTKEEDYRKKIVDELQAEAFKDRPASSGEYELPEFVNAEESLNSDLLKWWADHSFENGYSQEEFAKGIEIYKNSMPQGPDLDAERVKLGDGANQRIDAASMFAMKFFPKETLPAIERLCESAEGIMALEVIMESMKDGSFTNQANSAGGSSESDLKEMMRDERYWNASKRDADFVKKVDAGFKKIYG